MRWHEPDDARVSSPESVRGSGCNSPGLLGLVAFGGGIVIPSKSVTIGIVADVNPPPVPVGCAAYDPVRTSMDPSGCVVRSIQPTLPGSGVISQSN